MVNRVHCKEIDKNYSCTVCLTVIHNISTGVVGPFVIIMKTLYM